MKKVIKQTSFWIGAAALVLIVVLSVCSAIVHPSANVVEKFLKGMANKDVDTVLSCITPEMQEQYSKEEIQLMFDGTGLLEEYDMGGKMVFTVGEPSESEEGIREVPVMIQVISGKQVLYAEYDTLHIQEIDGREYIAF